MRGWRAPELPDVEGYRRLLVACLHGRAIRSVEVRDASVVRNGTEAELIHWLAGAEVGAVERRGKWILIRVGTVGTLLVHLGMTGVIAKASPGAPAERFDRLSLTTDRTVTFRDRRKLGGVWLVAVGEATEDITGTLGPDARGITLAALTGALRSTRRPVKSVLVDQSVIAGLGNMLSDEILWAAGIHPARQARSITEEEVRALHDGLGRIVRRAVRAGHIPRTRGWLASQRAAVEPVCPRCGARLLRHRVGDRRALMCPECQGMT